MKDWFNHNGTRTADGWASFDLEPPPRAVFDVYFDLGLKFVIAQCRWDRDRKILCPCGYDWALYENAKPLFWRLMPEPPSRCRVRRAMQKPGVLTDGQVMKNERDSLRAEEQFTAWEMASPENEFSFPHMNRLRKATQSGTTTSG